MTEKPATKRRGGRKPKLDPELVAAALVELSGNVSAVAKRFSVHRSSVQELIEKRPSLQRVIKDAREGMTDNAESALYRAVLAGEAWAVCFYLKTQGKSRGYVERQEVQTESSQTLRIRKVVVTGGQEAGGPGAGIDGPAA